LGIYLDRYRKEIKMKEEIEKLMKKYGFKLVEKSNEVEDELGEQGE